MKALMIVMALVCLGLVSCASDEDNNKSSTTTSNKSTFTLKGAGK